MPLVAGGAYAFERDTFIQFDGNGARGNFQRCVIYGGYKLIVDIFKDEIFLELYHLVTDRMETNNLALQKAHSDRIISLLKKLDSHMSSSDDLLRLPDDIYERFMKNAMYF